MQKLIDELISKAIDDLSSAEITDEELQKTRLHLSMLKKEKGAEMRLSWDHYKCSNCNNDLIQPYNYCRWCGCKLISKAAQEVADV